jgi:hypothetical protein
VNCNGGITEEEVEDMLLAASHQIGETAFELFASGEIDQEQLSRVYARVTDWLKMSEEILVWLGHTHTEPRNMN